MNSKLNSKLSQSVIFLLAITTGLLAAGRYYPGVIITDIAKDMGITINLAGMIITVGELAYAAGLFSLVILSDLHENKKLIFIFSGLVIMGLFLASISPNTYLLFPNLFIIGFFAVTAQIIVAYTADYSLSEQRAKNISTIMMGLISGSLLARTFAGVINVYAGWRVVYILGAVLLLLSLIPLYFKLPKRQPTSNTVGYLATIVNTWKLPLQDKVLLNRGVLGMLDMFIFNMLWTSLPLLLHKAPYNYSTQTIGLIALIGVAAVFATKIGGVLSDKGYTNQVSFACLIFHVSAWVLFYFTDFEARPYLIVLGIILLDFAVQGIHITNQATVYQQNEKDRGKVTSVYMTFYFVGALLGAFISSLSYFCGGWNLVVLIGFIISIIALLFFKFNHFMHYKNV